MLCETHIYYGEHISIIRVVRDTHDIYHGEALVSRIDKIIGLFCKRDQKRHDILQKRPIIYSILLTIATSYKRSESGGCAYEYGIRLRDGG